MIGLKYVGRKALPLTDNLYHTGFVWDDRDTVVWMDESVAAKFLRHPDVWQRTDQAPPKTVQAAKPLGEPPVEMEDHASLVPLVQLDTMDKPALVAFAQRHFGQRLAPNMTEINMRSRIRNWMNSPVTGG